MFFWRLSECAFDGPPMTKAITEEVLADAMLPFPLPDRLRGAAECDVRVVAAIGLLLSFCCPIAILWLVIPVVIDAIQRMTGWPWSHVSEKRRERNGPCWVHLDSASAVAIVFRRVWVETSLPSLIPRPVFRRLRLGWHV